MSLAERLTQEFYAWELRGRGWQEFPGAVWLEPPFQPFPGYFLPEPARDDGHRPSLLERLLAPRAAPKAPEIEEPEPVPFESSGPAAEFVLSLPGSKAVPMEVAERLILALSGAEAPLSFEILGLPESMSVRMASQASDRGILANQVRAFFPEASITEEPEGLRAAWTREPGSTSILHFGLAREFMLPLALFRSLDPDPLLPVFGALSELEAGEAGLVQVLFSRASESWAESVMRSVVTAKGEPFFADFPELTKRAREKVSRPLFAACIRLAAKSASEAGAWRILRDLAGALTHFGDPAGNDLLPLAEEGEEALAGIFSRTSRRPGMILASDELAALVHLPSASVRLPKFFREVRRTKAAPKTGGPGDLLLGENAHHGRIAPVTLPLELRLRHLHVIGASGTGKSSLLLDLVMQDAASGCGVAVIDPHGDLVDEILARIPGGRLGETILFDPSDGAHPVAWNILEAHSDLERTLLSSDLVGLFRRYSTSWGDQMTSLLGNAVLALLERPGATLLDLREFLVDRAFREGVLAEASDPYLHSYWRHEFPLAAKSVGAILTRLDGFLRHRAVRAIVGAKESRLDLRSVMDRGQILLARLAIGAVGEEVAAFLGSLLVSKLHQVAMSRQDTRREERRPFFLYADECQEVATSSMAGLLSGGRKYALGLTLAHQDLRQLEAKAPDVSAALLANAGTRVAFRVGERDARFLAEGLSFFEASDLLGLRVGEAVARIETSEGDLNLRTRLLAPVPEDEGMARREEVVRLSRERYAVRVEALETQASEEEAEPVHEEPSSSGEAPPVPPKEVFVPAPPVPPTPKAPHGVAPRPKPAEPAPLGRGGPEHQYLQGLVKRWGEEKGYRVTIEEPTPDGKGSVDVALRREGHSLACEISIASTAEQEVGNVEKCLAAGFSEVAVITLKAARVARIRTALEKRLDPEALARVSVATPEEFFARLPERPATSETVVGGYTVKVRRTAPDPQEGDLRAKALREAIAKNLKRVQREGKE